MVAGKPIVEIDVQDLAGSLDTVLHRVKREGAHFVVKDGGRSVATIAPADESPASTVTLADFVDRLRSAPRPDAAFADDLAAISADQPPLKEVSWGS